ncbi:hypothetical protein P3T40_000434 [Paraburkholderia sp. EB58]|jgi:hypothetical protein
MKMFRIVVTCAVALVAGHVCAQDQPAPPVAAQPAQDVGGISDASRSAAGAPQAMTRQQVYQDLVHSEQSGEQTRLWNGLYRGQ